MTDKTSPPELTLWRLVFPTRRAFVVAAIATLAGALTSTALMALVSELVAGQAAWATPARFGLLAVVVFVAGFCAQYVTAHLMVHTAHKLRVALMERVLHLPLARIEEIGAARLTKSLTEDLRTVVAIAPQVVQVATQLAVLVACFAYLIYTSITLFFWVLPVLAGVALVWGAPMLARPILHALAEADEASFRHFETLAMGAKELKMDRRQRDGWLASEVVSTSRQQTDLGLKVARLFITTDNISRLLPMLIIGGLLLLLAPTGRFDQATIIIFVFTILYMVQPFRSLLLYAQQLQRASVAVSRIRRLNIFDADQEPLGDDAHQLETACDVLEARNIHLRYRVADEERAFEVGPANMRIEGGEIVFVVGGNGSGKTTLIKLMAGLYEPTDGHLLFNGTLVDTSNRDWFRQHISSVFADFHLFENLHCGSVAEERARDYLKRLRIDHKVSIEDGRLTTLRLSAGQRRRLALVAAFLHDRPICIFDEWAADQDPEFKRFFYEEFLVELRREQKAVIVITHDDRYFGIADRVIKLDEGQVTESTDGKPPEVTNHRTMDGMLQDVISRLAKLEAQDEVSALLTRAREQQTELNKWRDRPPSPDRKYKVVAEVMAVIGSASRFQ